MARTTSRNQKTRRDSGSTASTSKLSEKPTYDSDEEPPEDPQEQLQWRGDPAETHSDWTIEVIDGKGKIDTYHVHKFALAFGARRSEFMEKEFQSNKDDGTTHLELDEKAAKVFPDLLDFLYKPDALVISTQTAPALHYLGQYLGIRRLRWEAKQFWKLDLSMKNVGTYYEHAYIFEDEKILESVKELLVKEIMNVKPTSKIVKVSHCDLWSNVVELVIAHGGSNLNTKIKYMSEIIAEFATQNVSNIDAKGFDKLTSADKLPVVSYKAAAALMEVKDKLGGKGIPDLHDRCTTAMAKEWAAVNSNLSQPAWKRVENSKQSFLSEVYKKTLDQCAKDKKKAEQELTKARKELESTKTQLNKAKGELKLYKPVKDKNTIRQRGRGLFRRSSEADLRCEVEGHQVYFRASAC